MSRKTKNPGRNRPVNPAERRRVRKGARQIAQIFADAYGVHGMLDWLLGYRKKWRPNRG